MKNFFRSLCTPLLGMIVGIFAGPQLVRARTRDVAFPFRMGAGFPGDVNRGHPFSVTAALLDSTYTFLGYGQPAIYGDGTTGAANTLRALAPADGSATPIKVVGALVRPYPTQQQSGGMTATFGAATPPTSGIADCLEQGFIMGKGKAGSTFKKGGAVYVWVAATSGANIQGEYQSAASTTNTVTITNARYHGPADASGNVEIEFWPQA